MLPIGQLLWEKELYSFKEFPPLQAPETYNLDGILKQMEKQQGRRLAREGVHAPLRALENADLTRVRTTEVGGEEGMNVLPRFPRLEFTSDERSDNDKAT